MSFFVIHIWMLVYFVIIEMILLGIDSINYYGSLDFGLQRSDELLLLVFFCSMINLNL